MSSSTKPFGHITLGVDFSENSMTALNWVHHHFAPKAVLDLVHAVELPRIPGFIRDAFPRFDEWVENQRRGATERLKEIAATHGSIGESIVGDGRPFEPLLERATTSGSEIVAVGAQGNHRGLGKLVGSTPERLLELSPVPVLVVRGTKDRRPTRVLVAVDDSNMTDRVIDAASRSVATTAAKVDLMTVTPTWFVESMRRHGGGEDVDRLQRSQKEQAAKWLRGVVERTGFECQDQIIEVGPPDLEILRAARRIDADLIVMGTRGGTLSSPRLIGGCARFVLSNANCPVLFAVGPK